MEDKEEFFARLSGLIHEGYEEGVPITEIYGALGLAQIKMEDDFRKVLEEERLLGSSDFRVDNDEELL